jgi:hypothetical protein
MIGLPAATMPKAALAAVVFVVVVVRRVDEASRVNVLARLQQWLVAPGASLKITDGLLVDPDTHASNS